jgi:hypothetical protein
MCYLKKSNVWRGGVLLLVLVFGTIGCGVQRGRFATTGDEFNALVSPVGGIDIVSGYETASAKSTGAINEQHLLYMLILTRSNQEHGANSSSDFGKYVTAINHTWNTENGQLTTSIHWDRQADTVLVGAQEFIRAKGNVFVVRVDTNGVASGQQLGNLGAHSNCQEVLSYIQQQLPGDVVISSAQINK